MTLRSSNRYYTMPSEFDLTPFGFTATESLAYAALLRLGPSTGYAVAHATRVARANTYGALEGLVSRTAALRLPGRPGRYRATDPGALIAQLAAEQGEALDRLSRSLRDADRAGPEIRTVTGERAVANLIMQVVARAGRRAEGVLSAELLRPTLPAWRRAKERAVVELRGAGDVPTEASSILSGTVTGDSPTVLLIDEVQVVVVAGSGETTAGVWSSHPAIKIGRASCRERV